MNATPEPAPTVEAGPAIFGPDLAVLRQLLRESEERKAALQQIEASVMAFRAATRTELERRGELIALLTQKHQEQVQANRRLCAEQVQLVRALRALVDAVETFVRVFNDDAEPGPLEKALREAKEVLALVEVPFG